MNVLSNYAANNRYQPQTMYRFTSAGFNNVVAFKAAPESFEEMFKKEFLYLLAKEGATCAYTGQKLFPKNDFLCLQNLKELSIPVSYAFDFEYLKKCNDIFFQNKNKIYNAINREHKRHPKYNLQEIIEKIYPEMVEKYVTKESNIIQRVMSNALGNNLQYKNFQHMCDFLILRNFFIDNFFKHNKSSKKTLSDTVDGIKNLNINNKSIVDKICRKIGKLYNVYNSTEDFVISCKSKSRHSEDIALELLRQSMATLDHIHPQTLQKQEALNKKNENNPFWVSILSCYSINKYKDKSEFNDFLKYSPFPVRKNLQKHIDSLIEIQKRWKSKNELKKANKLADYILVLKYELEKRGNRLKINVDELRDTIGQEDFDKRTEKVKDWLEIK